MEPESKRESVCEREREIDRVLASVRMCVGMKRKSGRERLGHIERYKQSMGLLRYISRCLDTLCWNVCVCVCVCVSLSLSI